MDKEGVEEFKERRRRTLGEEEDETCRWRRMSANTQGIQECWVSF